MGSCIQPMIVVTIQINWFEGEGNVKTYPFRFFFPSFLLTAVVNFFFPLLRESGRVCLDFVGRNYIR